MTDIATKFRKRALLPFNILKDMTPIPERGIGLVYYNVRTMDGVECNITWCSSYDVNYTREWLESTCREMYNLDFNLVESSWSKRLGKTPVIWSVVEMERI